MSSSGDKNNNGKHQRKKSSFNNAERRQEARECGAQIANIFEGDKTGDKTDGGVLGRIGMDHSPLEYSNNAGEKKRPKKNRNKNRGHHGGGGGGGGGGSKNRTVRTTTLPLSKANLTTPGSKRGSALKQAKQLQQNNRPFSKTTTSNGQAQSRKNGTPAKSTQNILISLGQGSKHTSVENRKRKQRQEQYDCQQAQGGNANEAVDLTSNDDDTGVFNTGRANSRGHHPGQQYEQLESASHNGHHLEQQNASNQETVSPKNPYNISPKRSTRHPGHHHPAQHHEQFESASHDGHHLEKQNPSNQDSASPKNPYDHSFSPKRSKHKRIEVQSPSSLKDQKQRNTTNLYINDLRRHPGQQRQPQGQKHQIAGGYKIPDDYCDSGDHSVGLAQQHPLSIKVHAAENNPASGTLEEVVQDVEKGVWRKQLSERGSSRKQSKPLSPSSQTKEENPPLTWIQNGSTTKTKEHTEETRSPCRNELGGLNDHERKKREKKEKKERKRKRKEEKRRKQQSKLQSPGEESQANHHEVPKPKKQQKKHKHKRKSQSPGEEEQQPGQKKRRSSGHFCMSSDESELQVAHGKAHQPGNEGVDPTVDDPIEECVGFNEEPNRKARAQPTQSLDTNSIPRKNRPKPSYSSQKKGNAKDGSSVLGLTKQNGNGGKRSRQKKANKIIPGDSFSNETKGTTRITRSAQAKSKQESEGGSLGTAIELLESDEDESDGDQQETSDYQNDGDTSSPNDTPRAQGTKPFRENVPRFALGKKIYSVETKVVLEEGILQLSAKAKHTGDKALIRLKDGANDNDVMMLKYYLKPEASTATNKNIEEEQQPPRFLSFLAMKVKRTQHNLLKTIHSSYDPDSDDASKAFVVIEFSESSQLENLLGQMKELKVAHVDNKARLPADPAKIGMYRKSLGDAGEEEAEKAAKPAERTSRRKRKLGPKVTDEFVANRPEDTVLLVYPFAGEPAEIENAAAGLVEASGVEATPGNETQHDNGMDANSDEEILSGIKDLAIAQSSPSDEDQKPSTAAGAPAKMKGRRHFLTIQVRDFERLCPGEFLNDSLIDFWMQWITRKLDPKDKNAGFHCFSSHFYTTLVDEGVSAVTKWTAKRGINIFEKKFIFIPINLTLHWSLCAVVNPGDIFKVNDDDPAACLLFLDSLKAHKKKKISMHVRKWLNSEWQRINNESSMPFEDTNNFPLLNPKVPYQNNTWDCGVFVCRYAYALFCLRNESFNRGEDWFRKDLTRRCKQEGLFDFDMEDIARLRDDIRVMIQNLSKIFVPWKEDRDRQLKLKRKAKKQKVHQKNEEEPSGTENSSPANDGATAGAEEGEGEVGDELLPEEESRSGQERTVAEQQNKETQCALKSASGEGQRACDARGSDDEVDPDFLEEDSAFDI